MGFLKFKLSVAVILLWRMMCQQYRTGLKGTRLGTLSTVFMGVHSTAFWFTDHRVEKMLILLIAVVLRLLTMQLN